MSQVFLAYKRADLERVEAVRRRLEALGVKLFIDQHLIPGENYVSVINSQINSAHALMVFWSKAAIAQDESSQNFLLSEAQRGLWRGILIPASFDRIVLDSLPVPFNTHHACDLTDWLEAGMPADHARWQQLLESLAVKIGRPGLPDLARLLDKPSDLGKRAFLRNFPADPFAAQFAAEIANAEIAAFDQRQNAAQARVDRRRRDAEKALKECRKEFEQQLAALRNGGEFFPPDPITAINDNVGKLTEQIDIYETALEELKAGAAQSEVERGETAQKIDELTREIANLGAAREAGERATAAVAEMTAQRDEARANVGEREARIAAQAQEIAAQKQTLEVARKNLDAQERAVKKLQSDNAALRRQLPDAPWSPWTSPRFMLGAGAVAGIVLTAFVAFGVGGTSLATVPPGAAEAQLKARADNLAKKEKAIDDMAAQLKVRDDALNKIASTLNQREIDLRTQSDRMTQRANSLTQRESTLNLREVSVAGRERDVQAKAKVQATPPAPTLQAVVAPPAAKPPSAERANAVAACDAAAGFEYDHDRPTGGSFKVALLNSELTPALNVCEEALRQSQSMANSLVEQRRIRVALGRIQFAQALQEAQTGNTANAQALFNQAFDSYKLAAKLDSGHAYYWLGAYYRSGIEIKTRQGSQFVPLQKDSQQAWTNFMASAQRGDPIGLTTVAFALLLPNWNDNIVKANVPEGRKYLDEALRAGFPRAHFVLGLAKLDIKDFPRDTDGGLKEIGVAYCKNDISARAYFEHKNPKPTCG